MDVQQLTSKRLIHCMMTVLMGLCIANCLQAQQQGSALYPGISRFRTFYAPLAGLKTDTFLRLPVLRQNYACVKPFFCRLEDQLWLKSSVKTSFRLGSLDFANSLEYPGRGH
ncbi:MAG: hypothetical protein K1X68_10265 [Saprospiraceae bacterium]|nr:hypothetical protein [Saprospiraceae bacterium]HMX89606.1 hypothetical protein [Saprospiraceae bacterium]HMZ41119.1 hypothetical protein [Saprospiraceae bacterium]HNB30765.1 hypothetical protein [Saprospiraceae bacterium]HNC36872.1 hypothetical protein [Saprospiraceae bacterium]